MDMNEIIKRSYKNCHAIGVNSIFLEEKDDGKLIRMFYTEPNHVLWKNKEVLSSDMSIAFHSHHCDIGIVVTHGNIINITGKVEKEINSSNIIGWQFESKLTTNSGSFKKTDHYTLMDVKRQKLTKDSLCLMEARELHTVYVEPGEEAAWIIYEGDSNPKHDKTCYSNNDLTQFKFEDHYKPITKEEVIKALTWR